VRGVVSPNPSGVNPTNSLKTTAAPNKALIKRHTSSKRRTTSECYARRPVQGLYPNNATFVDQLTEQAVVTRYRRRAVHLFGLRIGRGASAKLGLRPVCPSLLHI
jgi:hypothetical protein